MRACPPFATLLVSIAGFSSRSRTWFATTIPHERPHLHRDAEAAPQCQRAGLRQLRHPVYLEPLRAELAQDNPLALTGVGSIETRESAALLVEALASKSPAIVQEAAQLLRTPPDGLRGRPRHGLDAALTARILTVAEAMLQQPEPEICGAGAALAGAFGEAAAFASVQAALGRALRTPPSARPAGGAELPRPLRELTEAVSACCIGACRCRRRTTIRGWRRCWS